MHQLTHSEPTAVDQSGNLEDFLLLFNEGRLVLGVVLLVHRGMAPFAALVNCQKFVGYVLIETIRLLPSLKSHNTYIVVATEQNEQGANARGKEQESVLAECVGKYLSSTVSDSDFILLLLIVTIERGKVNVGACFVDAIVLVGRAENTVMRRN